MSESPAERAASGPSSRVRPGEWREKDAEKRQIWALVGISLGVDSGPSMRLSSEAFAFLLRSLYAFDAHSLGSLATFIAKEAEREQARAEARDLKIKKGLEGRPRPKARFDDTKYMDDHEAALESVGDAVALALARKKAKLSVVPEVPIDVKGKGKRKLESSPVPDADEHGEKTAKKTVPSSSSMAPTASTAYAWVDALSEEIRESSSEEEEE